MSHRERCMAGVFNKILGHLGIIKDTDRPGKESSPVPLLPKTELPATRVQACGGATISTNQKANECARVSTFNVVFNKEMPGAAKGGSMTNKAVPTGFRVRVSVPVHNEPFAPVVIECTPGSGGVQGLQWYSEKLMMDEDGDVAQEFLDEVISQASGPHAGYTRMLPSFKIKMKTRPAKLKGPVHTYDGNVVQTVESSCTFMKQKS
eukprot:c16014_g1_i2 orf=132-749(+)